MGCDGGTIPKRHELVKTAKRGEQKDKDMDRKAKWSSCSITQEALESPIMVCELGRLYSKESVLEHLLDQTAHDNFSHITSMKNVKEVKLSPNLGYSSNKGCHDQYYDTQLAKYVCPVVGLEMNGKYKFSALWSCGCVLSERALKEVASENCHSCGSPFEKDDIIVIYPEDKDLTLMGDNMKIRREKLKALRKEKKSKKIKRKMEETETSTSSTSSSSSKKKISKNHKFDIPKVPKVEKANEGTDDSKIDPKESKVYKSLFTSGQEKRDGDKTAHWITYNPYHL